MLDKLIAITRRYDELGEHLLQVGADYQRAGEINKERTELEQERGLSPPPSRSLRNLVICCPSIRWRPARLMITASNFWVPVAQKVAAREMADEQEKGQEKQP